MSEPKCGGVGMCTLPPNHAGRCVYIAHPPGRPPQTMPAGSAQVGHNPKGEVVIDFGMTGAWQWVTFTPEQAVQLARLLIARAVLIKTGLPIEVDDLHPVGGHKH